MYIACIQAMHMKHKALQQDKVGVKPHYYREKNSVTWVTPEKENKNAQDSLIALCNRNSDNAISSEHSRRAAREHGLLGYPSRFGTLQ